MGWAEGWKPGWTVGEVVAGRLEEERDQMASKDPKLRGEVCGAEVVDLWRR
jgi:hypothetical protein